MRRFGFLLITIINSLISFAQGYNQENLALTNFLTRMYKAEPFEGVKIVCDYDNEYLLSVVTVKKQASPSSMNRIAQVKSNRQVSQFINGLVTIKSETIIEITEDVSKSQTIEKITDIIKENSVGFTKSMNILNTIPMEDGTVCYMFYRNISEMN